MPPWFCDFSKEVSKIPLWRLSANHKYCIIRYSIDNCWFEKNWIRLTISRNSITTFITLTIIVNRGISFKHLVLHFLITVHLISGRSLLFEFRIKFRKMNTYTVKRNTWNLRFGLTTAVLPEVSIDGLSGVRVVVFITPI